VLWSFRLYNLIIKLIQRGGGTGPYETRQPAISTVPIPTEGILGDELFSINNLFFLKRFYRSTYYIFEYYSYKDLREKRGRKNGEKIIYFRISYRRASR
jgi:hypothetical protein